MNRAYDLKTFWQALFGLIALGTLQYVSHGDAFAIVAPLALFALFSRRSELLVFWMLVSIAFMMGNNILLPRSPIFFVAQRGMLFGIGFSMIVFVAGMRQSRLITPLLGLLSYIFYMIFPSMTGWSPMISFLKIFLFTVVFIAYYGVATQVVNSNRLDMRKMRAIVLAFFAFFIFGSLILIPFPSIGQLTGEEYLMAVESGRNVVSLFKGLTAHSQTLGPMMSMFFVFLLADFTFAIRRPDKLYIALMLICPCLIYKSSSRTSMAVFIMGMLIIGYCAIQERGIGARWRVKVKSVIFCGIVLGLLSTLISSSLRNQVARLVLKYGDENVNATSVTMERVMSTRQFLIDEQLYNFRKSPMMGNGFQVSEDMSRFQVKDWKSLLTAPVEKGVWVTAVLEEGGIFGELILWLFLVISGILLLRRRAYIGFTMLSALFISNMAEFTMFAMSSLGGFIWFLVFLGCTMDAVRQREDRKLLQEMGGWR